MKHAMEIRTSGDLPGALKELRRATQFFECAGQISRGSDFHGVFHQQSRIRRLRLAKCLRARYEKGCNHPRHRFSILPLPMRVLLLWLLFAAGVLRCMAVDTAQAHFQRGLALAARNEIDAAIGEFEMAIRLRPDFADAYFNTGALLHKEGNTKDALAALNKAIELQPSHAEALNALGLIFEQQGHAIEAIQKFDQALKHRPNFIEAHLNLAIALTSAGRLHEALDECERVTRDRPRWAAALFALARIDERLGQKDKAASVY